MYGEPDEDIPNENLILTINVEVAGRRYLGIFNTGATINIIGTEKTLEIELIIKSL